MKHTYRIGEKSFYNRIVTQYLCVYLLSFLTKVCIKLYVIYMKYSLNYVVS